MKNLFKLLLCGIILLGSFFYGNNEMVDGYEERYFFEAEVLDELGLFKGTAKGYELNQEATRAQGAVMLVRFMGVEAEAVSSFQAGDLDHPFRDVPSWADPHVAYLYKNGLSNGLKTEFFGADENLTLEQYTTMLLRFLNYNDEDGDFYWNTSFDFLAREFSLDQDLIDELAPYKGEDISRGLMVKLSHMVLNMEYKDNFYTPVKVLYYNRKISIEKLKDITNNADNKSNELHIFGMDEIRGVWFSYFELKEMLYQKNEKQFRNSVINNFNNLESVGFNTVYIQVRPFSDALYKSNVYPWSALITGKEGVNPGYDPLEICIEEAHKRGIRVEAWINPFRVRSDYMSDPISKDSNMYDLIQNKNNVFVDGNNVTLNPSSEEAVNMILKGVEEIVANYSIDGIHYDDYYYPSEELEYDIEDYNSYIELGGQLSHKDYRKNVITEFIEASYFLIKQTNPGVSFGISPQGTIENNANSVYLDVKEVVSREILDYIAPQVYYGFENEFSSYTLTIHKWDALVDGTNVHLIIGLAAYKVGRVDTWAGTGLNEWVEGEDLLYKMVEESRRLQNCSGHILFRYQFMFDPEIELEERMESEIKKLKSLY